MKYILIFLSIISLALPYKAYAQTPVEENVQLRIEGPHLKNKDGEVLQLKGMSLFWSQWQPKFYSAKTVEILKNDWQCNVLRAAMAVDYEGYLTYPDRELKKVETVIDAAIAEGLYVIVDWHDHHAEDHLEESKKFFAHISKKYGDCPNIIYEIYNEPLEFSWSEVLKPYHTQIIKAIRKNDSNNIIVCGTPSWSQRIDEALKDPIPEENVAYTLHFYADTHRQELRDLAEKAIAGGLPIFVTEYGTTDASGDGIVNEEQTKIWWKLLDNYKISYCNWSVADKDEACSVLKPESSIEDLTKNRKLTTSGRLVKAKLQN